MHHVLPSVRRRHVAGVTLLAAAALALAGCAAPAEVPEDAESPGDAAIGAIDLAAAGCPATIGIQTDWTPQGEHLYAYGLLGPGYTFDTTEKSVTGPLYAGGEYTGVDLKIVAGGPAVGFQSPASQLVANPDLMLAHTSTDDAISMASDIALTAVFADLDVSPTAILWDPATYPEVATLEDLGATGATIKVFDGQMYVDYLVQDGVFTREQIDPSHDGTPSAFVAAEGKIGMHGFAGAEPFILENEVSAWDRPVDFELVNDYGYQPYMSAVSVLSDRLEEFTPCLEALVPVLQQSVVDSYSDPDVAMGIIVEAGEAYGAGVAYSEPLTEYSVATQLELGLVGNGPNDYVGDFAPERMDDMFDFVSGLLTTKGVVLPDGLAANDLYTNEFIDTSIGF